MNDITEAFARAEDDNAGVGPEGTSARAREEYITRLEDRLQNLLRITETQAAEIKELRAKAKKANDAIRQHSTMQQEINRLNNVLKREGKPVDPPKPARGLSSSEKLLRSWYPDFYKTSDEHST